LCCLDYRSSWLKLVTLTRVRESCARALLASDPGNLQKRASSGRARQPSLHKTLFKNTGALSLQAADKGPALQLSPLHIFSQSHILETVNCSPLAPEELCVLKTKNPIPVVHSVELHLG
uniref:Uncharacterized protein n=1 Tax=Mus spicilegus TaxID=10103 RepID=A0A8C6HWB8_MUSSI